MLGAKHLPHTAATDLVEHNVGPQHETFCLALQESLRRLAARLNVAFEKGASIVVRPATPRERLDKLVTLEADAIALSELLQRMAGRGINYVAPEAVLDMDQRVVIRVQDMPIREVIETTAHAVGMACQISEHGIVSLAKAPQKGNEEDPRQRFREMIGTRAGLILGQVPGAFLIGLCRAELGIVLVLAG